MCTFHEESARINATEKLMGIAIACACAPQSRHCLGLL